MGKAADRGRRFPSLPILASVLFIVVIMGSQSYGGSYLGQYPGGGSALRSLPNVASVWIKMQAPPVGDGFDSLLAYDTIAAIFPIPGGETKEVTVIFTSLQGIPFKMTYYAFFQSVYGDLHSGARVYAIFMYSVQDGSGHWVLGYMVNVNTLG